MRITLLIIAILAVSAVAGAGDNLSELDSQMGPTDTHTVEYCVSDIVPPDSTVDVTVDPVCRDVDGISGCNGPDVMDPAEFSATPASPTIETVDGAGCVDINLETNNAEGRFYYTVNGMVAEAEVVSETGSVTSIPEFGAVAATLALGLIGIFIMNKR